MLTSFHIKKVNKWNKMLSVFDENFTEQRITDHEPRTKHCEQQHLQNMTSKSKKIKKLRIFDRKINLDPFCGGSLNHRPRKLNLSSSARATFEHYKTESTALCQMRSRNVCKFPVGIMTKQHTLKMRALR